MTGTKGLTARIWQAGIGCFAAILAVGLGTASADTLAYVTNRGSNSVTVVDVATQTVRTTVPVGAGPSGVAVSDDGQRVYVANHDDNTVSVIDTSSQQVIATVPVGLGPVGLVVLPDSRRVYVANTGSGTLSVIDAATDTVSATVAGLSFDNILGNPPAALQASRDGEYVYVTDTAGGSAGVLWTIDTSTNMAVRPSTAYVPNEGYVALSPAGDVAYVDGYYGYVSRLDLATGALSSAVSINGGQPGPALWQLAMSPDGSRLFAVSGGYWQVYVLDPTTLATLATIPVGNSPRGLAFSPDGSLAYVTNEGGASVSVIDVASLTVITTIPVGSAPFGVAIGRTSLPTAVTVFAASGSYAGPVTLSAQLTTNGTALEGYQLSFTLAGAPVGSAITDAFGVGRVTTTLTVPVGDYPSGVTANFAGDARYRMSSGSGPITANAATPSVSWPQPAPITFGTALGPAQLNATSDVPGVFAYAPDLGAVLAAGSQVLTATFTPSDPNYASVTVQRQLLVDRAGTSTVLVITSIAPEPGGLGVYRLDATLAGAAPGALQPTGAISFIADGATLGTATLATGTPAATLLTAALQPGTHALSAVYTGDANYGGSSGSGSVVVKRPEKGAVRGWGYNAYGQLGVGGTTSQAFAASVRNDAGSFMSDAVAAVLGARIGLVVRADGSVWSWGANWYGQMGDGTLTSREYPGPVIFPDGTPLNDVVAVAAGSEYSLALRRDGTVWAWGYNVQGMVGDNTTTSRLNPVQVRLASGPPLDSVVAISAGESFSIALRSDGTVWTWGFNGDQQLGDGTNVTRLGAVQVLSAGGGPLQHVAFIAAGPRHGLAVHVDGTVSGWGLAGGGQLGDGGSGTWRSTAVRMRQSDGTPFSDARQVAGGVGHSLVLTSAGEVWAVGANAYGQLGTGASSLANVFAPERVVTAPNLPLSQVTVIGAGGYSSYAVTADGRLWAWGDNTAGQIGDGSSTKRSYPTAVLDGWTGAPLLNVFSVSPKLISAFALAHRAGAGADAEALSFASQQNGTTSAPQTLTVSSTGAGDLFVRNAYISGANPGDYRIAANGCDGRILQPGSSCALQVVFSPTAVGTRSATLTFVANVEGGITPVALSGRSYGVPQISWPTPASIVYGTALDATQLNASANVAGTFTYAPGPGAVLGAGTYTLSATFQPDDPNWMPASANVSLDVLPRKAIVQWTEPAPIVYGTTLSADLFGATADVPGTFTFSPELGTVLGAGQRSVQIVFTPDDAINFVGRGGSVPLTVVQATPQVAVTGGRVFYDGAQHAATAVAIGGAGETLAPVTITYSGSPIPPVDAGTYVVQALYPGDVNHTAATATSSLVIDPAVSALGIAASTGASSTFGESVTFTADISIVQGVATPTGEVTFYADGMVLGSATLNGASASLATSTLSVGGHTVTASYSGTSNIDGSTTPKLAFSVLPADTTSTLSVNPTPSGLNASVSLTATIAVNTPGSGVPTGSVEFFDGGLSIGSATLAETGGIVSGTITTAFTTAGAHTLTAAFHGDAQFNASTSEPFTHTVNDAAASTSTSLAQSSDTTVVGAAVTLTASVQPQAGKGNPTGTVEFLDGSTVVASAPLLQSGSKFSASVDVSTLALGTHTLTARYAGDLVFSGSTSTPLLQTIYQATAPKSTTTTVTSSPNPSLAGQMVTITAEVKSGGQGTPTGTVAFYVDGVRIGSSDLSTTKNTTLATVAVDTMATGNHTLTAVYEGDVAFAGSGSAQLSQCVGSSCVIANGNGKKK